MLDADPLAAKSIQLQAADVVQLLPHRDPFLFLEWAEISGIHAKGRACWLASHPILQGHFPGQPIVPGVCQAEALAQLAGIWCRVALADDRPEPADAKGYLSMIKQSTFRQPVLPDQTLELSGTARRISEQFVQFVGEGHVGVQLALRAEVVIAVAISDR
jgi:3-hydroxyacyl-[acyl-carrier-protein] dehydratase